jgi:hypothetical protein
MANRLLPDDYFTIGVFALVGSELLRSYTCLDCGLRSATWPAFRTHRLACLGHQRLGAQVGGRPDALLALVRAEAGDVPTLEGAPVLTLTAPPPAGQALEPWGHTARSTSQACQ